MPDDAQTMPGYNARIQRRSRAPRLSTISCLPPNVASCFVHLPRTSAAYMILVIVLSPPMCVPRNPSQGKEKPPHSSSAPAPSQFTMVHPKDQVMYEHSDNPGEIGNSCPSPRTNDPPSTRASTRPFPITTPYLSLRSPQSHSHCCTRIAESVTEPVPPHTWRRSCRKRSSLRI